MRSRLRPWRYASIGARYRAPPWPWGRFQSLPFFHLSARLRRRRAGRCPAKSRQIPPNPAKSRQIPLSRLRPLSGVTNRISGDAKRVRDADTQSVKCQQWNRQQEWRHHVGRRQRNRHDENSENRVAQMMDHHAVIDESKPRQKKCENRHLERDPESQQKFRRKSQILTYPDSRCNTDAGVLVQEK